MEIVRFIEVGIYHRMATLRMLFFITLTFGFKVKHFLVMHLQ